MQLTEQKCRSVFVINRVSGLKIYVYECSPLASLAQIIQMLITTTIVDNDRIVGLVDWEMAGYLGWKTAGAVHLQIRTPKRENFAALDLLDEFLSDILFWNDLYTED